MIWQIKIHGVLAQLVERQVRNLEARGSTPLCSTKKESHRKVALFFGGISGVATGLRILCFAVADCVGEQNDLN